MTNLDRAFHWVDETCGEVEARVWGPAPIDRRTGLPDLAEIDRLYQFAPGLKRDARPPAVGDVACNLLQLLGFS